MCGLSKVAAGRGAETIVRVLPFCLFPRPRSHISKESYVCSFLDLKMPKISHAPPAGFPLVSGLEAFFSPQANFSCFTFSTNAISPTVASPSKYRFPRSLLRHSQPPPFSVYLLGSGIPRPLNVFFVTAGFFSPLPRISNLTATQNTFLRTFGKPLVPPQSPLVGKDTCPPNGRFFGLIQDICGFGLTRFFSHYI